MASGSISTQRDEKQHRSRARVQAGGRRVMKPKRFCQTQHSVRRVGVFKAKG